MRHGCRATSFLSIALLAPALLAPPSASSARSAGAEVPARARASSDAEESGAELFEFAEITLG